jgi:hypothetical protein
MSSNARLRRAQGALFVACAALSACGGDALSTGDPDDLVVAAHPELWPRIESRLKAKLEPSLISTTGKAFAVTWRDPTKPEWGDQRRARQLLLIGTADDPWMKEALSRLEQAPPTAPALLEVEDVWAKPQQVTLLTLPEGDARAAVTAKLDSLRAGLEERYRAWVVGEMFAAGANKALSDSLLEQSGFTVLVPRDYATSHEGDIYAFRKEGDSAQVIRQVAVTWRSPIPSGLQGEGLLAWRREVAAAAYGAPQSVALGNVDATQTTHRGNVAYQLLGTWRNPPASGANRGPFIMRAVFCPTQDRVYLVDGWLWAPDPEKQHRYLVELESILNSFRCGSARSSQPNE